MHTTLELGFTKARSRKLESNSSFNRRLSPSNIRAADSGAGVRGSMPVIIAIVPEK